ncbi:glycosyltransferase family 4 protein [Candidatus Wolfebacteria bacterium]|nr:glycosyltransferase family 4 protein [Candidatus Wolfebacteria bacterium]
MKIIVSVGGRFHAFNLSQQLFKRGYLEQLITSYPKFEVVKYGIPKNKVNSVLIKEIIERGWKKFPRFIRERWDPQYFIHEIYDWMASMKIHKADIFVGWSSFSFHSLRKARGKGAIIVIERGSSHIVYQNDILKEEYEKFGLKLKLPHRKIIEKELREYEEADYIAIPSSFVRRTFLEKGVSADKLIQVSYGVDLSAFRQIPKTDDVFRVVFVGGMTLRKGVHYLLRAFSELNLPNSELLLIGSITDEIKPFFKKYEGKFKWIGPVPQKELYKYYSQGSVFVMPSIEEGLAMVQPQAMACGLPVVCTTNTGGEDIIKDGIDGFVIPIRDIERLKEKLLYLYKNSEICVKMGQFAKERVDSGFTWDDYGEKTVKAYELILKNKKYAV